MCADPEYRQGFEREADTTAALWHPHIVEGTDTDDPLAQRHPRGMPADVVRIITAVETLDYAHQKGLLHHDVQSAGGQRSGRDADVCGELVYRA